MLRGKLLLRKPFNDTRKRGLGYFGLAALGYYNLHYLTLLIGSSYVPLFAIAGFTISGMSKF
jgi:hypothetical protein